MSWSWPSDTHEEAVDVDQKRKVEDQMSLA